ncbi:MAG: hypothetical protein LBI28_01220, partial [Treponema sp.]|nr:hypothetical protein [Treponema sp.]
MFLFLKKAFCKKAALLGLALVLLTSVLFVSCDDGGGSDPVNAKQPSITTQPSETTDWDVSTTDSIDLTVAATSPDGGVISYQWYSNSSASNTGGSIMDGKTEATLTLAKNDYLVNGNYYFYAITTNTNNSVNGTKTATAASSAAAVTVSGNASLPITSQADMEKIGTGTDGWLMSATYVLANDITLTDFTPVGIEATPFTGTFLGNGKTITLTSFASVTTNREIGIFGYVKGASASTKAVIKNLTVQSSVNVTETGTGLFQNVGLVAGYAEYAEIDNITLSGNFSYTSDGRIHLGGIAGTINQTGT